MPEWLSDASAWVLPLILAVTLHEAAHGWMAEKFGDDTARQLGRVTFNPLKHIDRFGTIIFPGLLLLIHSPMLFGYAKPVPVNFKRLNPPRIGMFMVSIAGVATNVLLAIASGLLLHIESFITPEQAPWIFLNLYRSIMINCVLAVFNMIPILPLDGGRAVDSMLSGPIKKLYGKLERYGIIIVMIFLLVPPVFHSDAARNILEPPIFWLMDHILWVTGNGQGDNA